jgi:hypothetical protein
MTNIKNYHKAEQFKQRGAYKNSGQNNISDHIKISRFQKEFSRKESFLYAQTEQKYPDKFRKVFDKFRDAVLSGDESTVRLIVLCETHGMFGAVVAFHENALKLKEKKNLNK